jgi:hypothetical protein
MANGKGGLISAGAKTYCQQWFIESLYGRKKEFYSKPCEKGNLVENDAIEFIGEVLGLPLTKNEEYKEDDYKTGTCDIDTGEYIIDNKSPETCFTFPLLADDIPDKAYMYQLQGYMDLWGRSKAKLIYTLMDTPDKLLISEANYLARDMKCEFQGAFDIVKEKNTYSNYADELRYKEFEIERDEKIIKDIHDKVKLCQEYVITLQSKIKIGEF